MSDKPIRFYDPTDEDLRYMDERLREAGRRIISGITFSEQERKNLAICEKVLDEIRGPCFEKGINYVGMADFVAKWLETQNQYYLDWVLVCLTENGISLPPTIQNELCGSARRRLQGNESAGTAAKVNKQVVKRNQYIVIANLCFRKATLEKAVEAAVWWAKKRGMDTVKASTLEADYVREFRQKGEERLLFETWNRQRDNVVSKLGGDLEEWQSHILVEMVNEFKQQDSVWMEWFNSLPPLPDESKGTRR